MTNSGIESHNTIGIEERYHQPLRNTFGKLKFAYQNVSDTTLLALSVKAFNDTIGLE